ncbi:MAG: RloB family protein [Raoultibacter sp.]
MKNRKVTDKYYFSVEGETEKWYLDWLCAQINTDPRTVRCVALDTKIQKNPLKRAKSLTVLDKVKVCHVFDFESEDEIHTKQFRETLERMKHASKLGRSITYVSGYSNFTFELWILLHREDARAQLGHRRDYLRPINRAFSEQFESLDQYKHEANFKRVLSKLSLDDVVDACRRARAISHANREDERCFAEHCGYTYCLDNPATELWVTIRKILGTAGIFGKEPLKS